MKEKMLLLALIRAALNTQTCIEYDNSMDIPAFLNLIISQKLILLIYPALELQKDARWKQLTTLLKKYYYESLHRILLQQKDIEAFLQEMETRKEACLPLKGWIIREYYPDVFLRSMSDFDILMKDFDRSRYQEMMEFLGYSLYRMDEGQHDVYYKKPYTIIELHKSLSSYYIKNEMPEIDRWLEQIWERCILQKGKSYSYQLSPEDFYLYHLLHMYKHIKEGGCGIRPMIDIYVFLEKEEARLNWGYLRHSLKDMHLADYEHTIRTMAQEWFSSEKVNWSEEKKKLLDFLLGSGLYGSKENQMAGRIVSAKGKSGLKKKCEMLLELIFLPYNEMTRRFRILKKFPFLLPVCWIIRICNVTFEGKFRLFFRSSKKDVYREIEKIYRIIGVK